MDYETYRKDVKKVNNFDAAFKPWKKWQDVKLSDICPCITCDVMKELHDRQYEVHISGGLQEEIAAQCKHCKDVTLWQIDCVEKLRWYEDKDEMLKQKGVGFNGKM